MAFTSVQIGPSVASTGGSVACTLPAASTAGTLLVACLANSLGNAFTAPPGWMVADDLLNAAVLYYPGNPGGITTATFTAAGSCRGTMAEFSTAAGTTQALDKAGHNATTPPATSFPVTATGSSAAGDLGIASFGDIFSTATSGASWTLPAGYTVLRTIVDHLVNQSASYKIGLSAGTQSVTAAYSSSANQTGWAGVFAAFSETTSSGLSVATTSPMPDGQIGIAYNQTLQAAGGTAPFSWAITAGALPAGLSLISSGGRGGAFGITFGQSALRQDGITMEFATTRWEGLVGRTVTCSKWYAGPSNFPTQADTAINGALDLGMTLYLCYMPAFNPPTTADFNGLKASLQAFKNMGLTAKVELYQEIEEHAPTPAQYKALVQFYEPAVHAVYPGGLVHGSAAGPGLTAWTAYFPTTLGIGSLIDEYGIDFYASAYARLNRRLDGYAALVAATGKKLGVTEMGSSIADQVVPPDSVVAEYVQHVMDIATINPPGSFMWYEQDNKNIHNVISDPADFRIPLLQALADSVAGGSASGRISGTPSAAGLASFTARVTDNNSVTASAALTINITSSSAPLITTLTLPAATVGVAYSQQVIATGGNAPLSFTISAGALPDGLAIGHAGFIFGTPTASAATSGFTVRVTDVNNQADTQALFITVVTASPPPAPAPPPLGLPQVIIEAGLVPAAPQVPAGTFILDDPVYGKLDSGNQLADTTAWTDIAFFFRTGSISRPSTRVQGPLITYQGGAASAVFDNADGRFDPDNPSSPYAGALRPMIPVRIRAVYGSVSYNVWAGFISSWQGADLTYDMGYDEATLTADDGFKVLAGITIPAIPLGSDGVGDGDGEDTGARVTRILNAAAWYTDHRRVDTGDSTVQGTLYGDTALNLLQLSVDNEIGSLYIDGGGNLTFRHRQAVLEDTRSTQVQAVFGDLPGAAHGAFTELACIPHRRASDDTTLANDIQATSAGGTPQEAESLSSQRTYLFPRSYARTDLILEDDPTTLAWAQWVLSVSLTGDDRFDAITIDPLADPAGLFPQVLGREIGDRIQVWRRPQNSGTTITQDCFIRGIQHDVDAVNGTWSTTWALQSALRYTGFLILDDPANGKLNTGKLAF
jgi:hypothetical protein